MCENKPLMKNCEPSSLKNLLPTDEMDGIEVTPAEAVAPRRAPESVESLMMSENEGIKRVDDWDGQGGGEGGKREKKTRS